MKILISLLLLSLLTTFASAQTACFPVALGEDNVFCDYQYCDTAGDPFIFSKGIYRMPYLELTSVHVNENHITSCPRGEISFSAARDYYYDDRFVVAAADGWVRNYYTSTAYNPNTGEDFFISVLWMEHPNGEWTMYENVLKDDDLEMQTLIPAGTLLGTESSYAPDSSHKINFSVFVPVDTNELIFIKDDESGNYYLNMHYAERRIPLFCNISGHLADYLGDYTALSCTSSCTATLPIIPTSYEAGDFKAYIGDEALSTDLDLTFETASSGVIQSSSSVTLNPGFQAEQSSFFEARTGDCGGAGFIKSGSPHVSDAEIENQISVFPNPANHTTKISLRLNRDSKIEIQLRDITGRILNEVLNSQALAAGSHEVVADLSNTPSGAYFFEVIIDGENQIKKLIVEK
jgi:hypothetical protein